MCNVMPWTCGFELTGKTCVDNVCYFGMLVGWQAGVYEYGSVYRLCMSIAWFVWVKKRVYISMEVFKLCT